MTLKEKLSKFPHKVTSFGKIGKLSMTNAEAYDSYYEGYWLIQYIGDDNLPVESMYDKHSKAYLLSFEDDFEKAVDDMLDKLKRGGHI